MVVRIGFLRTTRVRTSYSLRDCASVGRTPLFRRSSGLVPPDLQSVASWRQLEATHEQRFLPRSSGRRPGD